MSKVFDFRDYDTAKAMETGAKLILRNPYTNDQLENPDGSRPTMVIYGIDSPTYRAAQRQITDMRLETASGSGTRGRVTAKDLEDEELELTARSIKSCENLTLDGEVVQHSLDNMRKLLHDFPWLYEQVAGFSKKRLNYRQD